MILNCVKETCHWSAALSLMHWHRNKGVSISAVVRTQACSADGELCLACMSVLSPTPRTDARAGMRWSAVCCLLLAVFILTCMEAPVRLEPLDQRKHAPHRQTCSGCDKIVSRGYITRHRCLRMVSLTTERDRKWHPQLLHHKVQKRDSFCCAQSSNSMQCLHRVRAIIFGGCH